MFRYEDESRLPTKCSLLYGALDRLNISRDECFMGESCLC